jgi:hypothetical protein
VPQGFDCDVIAAQLEQPESAVVCGRPGFGEQRDGAGEMAGDSSCGTGRHVRIHT